MDLSKLVEAVDESFSRSVLYTRESSLQGNLIFFFLLDFASCFEQSTLSILRLFGFVNTFNLIFNIDIYIYKIVVYIM